MTTTNLPENLRNADLPSLNLIRADLRGAGLTHRALLLPDESCPTCDIEAVKA